MKLAAKGRTEFASRKEQAFREAGASSALDLNFRWSPLLALAWVATRNLDIVRGVHSETQLAQVAGSTGLRAVSAKLKTELAEMAANRVGILSFADALRAFFEALTKGKLCGEDREEEPSFLTGLTINSLKYGDDTVGLDVLNDHSRRWEAVTFQWAEVCRLWPGDVPIIGADRVKPRLRPEKAAQHLRSRRRDFRYPPNEDTTQGLLDGAFPGHRIPRQVVRDAMAIVWPDRKRGPRT